MTSPAGEAEPQVVIADQLLALIYGGALRPGERLVRADLAAQYVVPVPVITKALRVLKDRGVVVHRGGRGDFVREQPPTHSAALRRLLEEGSALLAAYEAGTPPRRAAVRAWRDRARAAGADV